MTPNNRALRIDHETAVATVKEIAAFSDAAPSHCLSFLYGARAALIHGGIPDCFLQELDAAIVQHERNRDLETAQAEKIGNAT